MAVVLSHHEFIDKLCDALGLPKELPVVKLVIEAQVGEVVKVYVKTLLDSNVADLPAVLGAVEVLAVKDVEVGDDCEVIYAPTEEGK